MIERSHLNAALLTKDDFIFGRFNLNGGHFYSCKDKKLYQSTESSSIIKSPEGNISFIGFQEKADLSICLSICNDSSVTDSSKLLKELMVNYNIPFILTKDFPNDNLPTYSCG
ncbi:MAG: hypothetical protein ACON5A_05450 [Candidatus Comchoanobacterales bacterium]